MKTQEENLDCPFDFTSRRTLGRCDCKSKQETLEEAANKFASQTKPENSFEEGLCVGKALGFIEGAKHQTEKRYSKEELKQAFLQGQESIGRDEIEGFQKTQPFEEWFEQFKKMTWEI